MTLPSYELVEWFAEAEGQFDLSLSHSACQPQLMSDLLDEAQQQQFAQLTLPYGEFAGLQELRQLIAAQYETIKPADVLTFNGPSEAIYTFMRATLSPGDRVVIPFPVFEPLQAIAKHIDCDVRYWRATDELACRFDVNDLADVCNESTKLIVVNFPHNPSGQTVSEDDLRRIVDIAKSNNAILFSDEAFRLLELPPNPVLPAACDLYDKAVSMTGMSKPYGLGGLRIGWLATRCTEVFANVQHYRLYSDEMTNTPCQWLACRALERSDTVLDRNRKLIASNLEQLEMFVKSHEPQLKLVRPQAGTMALVEQRTPLTSAELCRQLLAEERLFVIPGHVFGMSDRLLRLGLGMTDFAQGLDRLGRFLNRVSEIGDDS